MSIQPVVVSRATFRGEVFSLPSRIRFAMERLEQRRVLSAALDTNFGVGGIVELGSTAEGGGDRVAYLSDGRFLTFAVEVANNQSATVITRHLSDGSIDATFGTSGIVRTLAGSGGNDYLSFGIDIDDDGNIILIGGSNTSAVPSQWTARLTPEGALDPTFGTNGILNYQDGDFHLADGSVIHELGRNIGEPLRFSRLLADGSTDMSFGTDGVLNLPDYTPKDTAIPGGFFGQDHTYPAHYAAVTVDPQGRLYFVGQAYDNRVDVYGGYSALVRVTADGQLDHTFGEKGMVWVSDYVARGLYAGEQMFDSQGRMVIAVAEQNAGFVASTTDTTRKVRVIRILHDGTFDPSFGKGGSVLIEDNGERDVVLSHLRLQEDDKILLVASYTASVSGSAQRHDWTPTLDVLRLNVDGTPDTSFGANGRFTAPAQFDSGTLEIRDIDLTAEALTIAVSERSMGNGMRPEGVVLRIDLDGVIAPIVRPAPEEGEPAIPSTPGKSDPDVTEEAEGGGFVGGGFTPVPSFAPIQRDGKSIVLGSLGEDVLETRRNRAIDLV